MQDEHHQMDAGMDGSSPVDAAKIKAEFKNGVLTVTLPKHEDAKPKKVAIEAA